MKKTKICCISSIKEAELAIKFGASAIGLVGEMPSGPGVISDDLIAEIANIIPKNIDTFLLTSKTKVSEIIKHYNKVKTTTIQLVDELTEGTHYQLKKALPNVKVVQVLHVIDQQSVVEAIKLAPNVDAILLDSGNPNLKIKELGGTGRVHNWELSKKIVEKVKIPVFLAGGISKNNVLDAIEMVNPYGLDLCSSVRTNGNLDEIKLMEFFEVIKNK
ncbi:MAG: phosphoribosylanthranilate isomerase [Lutibacter sp.]|uniref:phosphoribosylanthranilate isomerase n=1 Tax=Lutibacter sp. TaxID=1925666 RepID=UPI00299D5C06|nr:phosphoribosylanthranilate isomerase [Lutibacter sp.]MDX1828517.1 phosphoribosylanthranilate isomerase [Lutibacter sp.]